MKSSQQPISIKRALRIYSLVLATLPILAVGLISLYILTANIKEEISTKHLILTRSLSNEVEAFMIQPRNLLKQVEAIAERPDLIATNERNVYLESVVKNYPLIELIMLINSKGRVTAVAPYNANIDGIDMSGKDFFQKVQAQRKLYWSPTFIPPYADQPTISISIPFAEGIITGYLNLAVLGGIVEKFNAGAAGSAVIVDNEGTVIAHPNHNLVTSRWNLSHYGNIGRGLSGEEGVFPFKFESQTYLGGVAVVPGVNWVVHISQPLDIAYGPVRRIGMITGVGIGLAMILAMVISLPIMKKILTPLIRLTEQSGHIAQGDYRSVNSKGAFREIDELTRSFNLMVTAVQKRESQLRQSEAEILKHTTMLEAANRELAAARDSAESANRAKTTFLANMSHELRTPLNAILGFTHLMQRDAALPLTVHKEVGIVNRCGQHLLALINDVLEIAKIETGQITLNPGNFDLHWFLQGIEEIFLSRSSSEDLEFIMDLSSDLVRHVKADEGKLRQILINLLGNAMKFTKTGRVELRVTNTDLNGRAFVRFEIEDTGIGIASDDLERIFDPFVQSGTQTLEINEATGTGLGLAISRQYVMLMGGDITVKSIPGKGTVFSFEIPVQVMAVQDTVSRKFRQRAIALAPGQPDYRILIVEDRDENRLLLKKLLNSVGLNVREAVDGQEGVEIFQSWQPDLVWMDMRMPGMDGYEATRRIKALEKGATTPIIAITAHAFEEERDQILAAGCDDFVRKPFHLEEIFDVMAKHLKVEFIYEDLDQQVDPSPEILLMDDSRPDMSPELPEDLVSKFKEAIVSIDTNLIQEYIERINEIAPSFGKRLSQLADNFQYDRILSMISAAIK